MDLYVGNIYCLASLEDFSVFTSWKLKHLYTSSYIERKCFSFGSESQSEKLN